jgi:hypothetical protein
VGSLQSNSLMRRSPKRVLVATSAAIGAIVLLAGPPLLATTESSIETTMKELAGISRGRLPCRGFEPTRSSSGWAAEPELPFAQDEPRAVSIGPHVYLAGGLTDLVAYGKPSEVAGVRSRIEVRSIDSFLRFDTLTGRYERLRPLPIRLNHVGVVAYGGDVFVVGGHGDLLEGAEPSAAFYRYSLRTGRWSTMPPMPTPRGAAGTAVIGDHLYVVGGMNAGRPLATLEIFDFTTGTWSTGAAMRRGREHVVAAARGGRLYVAGGRDLTSDALRIVERYDPGRAKWERMPDLPIGTAGGAAVDHAVGLLVLGGNDDEGERVIPAVQRLNPATPRWVLLAEMRSPRHGFAAATVGPRVYTFGGSRCGSFGVSKLVESVDPREDAK